jgi:hypothetical protein
LLKGDFAASSYSQEQVCRYEFSKMLAGFFNLNPNLIKPAKMSELH